MQGFCGTYWGFHPGIDINDFIPATNNLNSDVEVVAVRAGTIVYAQTTNMAGIAVIIKTVNNSEKIEYDLYLHLEELEILNYQPDFDGNKLNIPIAKGDIIARMVSGGAGAPHLHFTRLNSWDDNIKRPGYKDDYTNILNPLYIWGEDFDPQGARIVAFYFFYNSLMFYEHQYIEYQVIISS